MYEIIPQFKMSFYRSTNDTCTTYQSTSSSSFQSLSKSSIIGKPKPTESLLQAFQKNSPSLNSPWYKLDKTEFNKVLNAVNYYKSTYPNVSHVTWCFETGEDSRSYTNIDIAEKPRLVCHIKSTNNEVLGKLTVANPEDKLIVPIESDDGNIDLLKNMETLTNATIKDRYQVPMNHKKLSEAGRNTQSRLQLYGVVTAINKNPSRTKQSFHSLICISDPSLACDGTEDLAPSEFKMHLFLPQLEDHPEFHRGDVVRFTNVKIESHQNRCDGRVFNKKDIIIFCGYNPDNQQNRNHLEAIEERVITILTLAKWWKINHRFFDYLTPHPLYHSHYKFTGVREFKEFSNQLTCDVYCKIMSMSDDSCDLNFLNVCDGTIFTLEEEQNHIILPKKFKNGPMYGYLGLVVFSNEYWKMLKTLQVHDYLLLKEVRVIFLANQTLAKLDEIFPKRYPCVLLRPSPTADGVKKIPYSHHEASKIRSRLHRLSDALEKMSGWKRSHVSAHEYEDSLLARLNDPSVQEALLKRVKRV